MISTMLADPDPHRPIATASLVRVTRPPRLDPPFDDERGLSWCHEPIPARPASTPSPVSPASRLQDPRDPATPSSARAATAYVRLCIEVLNGYRPASHLRQLGGPVEFADIVDQLRLRYNRRGRFGPDGRGRPAAAVAAAHRVRSTGNELASGFDRAGAAAHTIPLASQTIDRVRPNMHRPPALVAARHDRNAASAMAPVSLARLRVSEPLDGIAEVVAVLSQGGASLAMAMRLERQADAWTCVLVQVI
jgi:Family of unknown function (DUF6459)